MIAFSCQKCGKHFNLKPEFAGRATTCSGCKSPIVVPEIPPVADALGSPIDKIAFSCAKCGMKFDVSPVFAGRRTSCPTCKTALVVPTLDQTAALVPTAGRIDGPSSSLAQAHVEADVTLNDGSANSSPAIHGIIGNGARYVIDKELARGGMGAVLRAIDCDIRREVAIKYLLDQTNAKNKVRLVEEAQITGQLEHPNIVPIHELGVDAQKRIFFTMKMVKGRSIAQIITMLRDQPEVAEKEYTLSRLLNIFVSICNALAYAHSRGVVHRDLKPANVMVGDFGEVYVMDWGLAKVLGRPSVADDKTNPGAQLVEVPSATLATSLGTGNVMTSREADADLTQAGAVIGTPVYMPPEQAAGRIEEIDERSDIYSMGAILYELLTLQPPIDKTGGFWPIIMRVGQGKIDAPEIRAPDRARAGKIPPELSAIAMKALAKEKRDRYQTIDALRKDIERFTEGRSVSAKQDTVREQAIKFVKRNKAVSFATAAALAVLLVIASIFLKVNYSARVLAENNHAAYLKEQEQRVKQGRDSIPSLLTAAKLLIEKRNFDAARAQVRVALEFDPDHTDLLNLRGHLALIAQDLAPAQKDLEAYASRRPNDPLARDLLQWLKNAKANDVGDQVLLAEIFTRHLAYDLADGTLQFLGENVPAVQPKLLALFRQRVDKAWPGSGKHLTLRTEGFSLDLAPYQVTSLEPIRGMPLTALSLFKCHKVRDLEPLKGMLLNNLDLQFCGEVRDLEPLRDMRLFRLSLQGCERVRDLGPLKGMPLNFLDLQGCRQISDLEPLKGMPLTSLSLTSCVKITDLTPLKGMPLTDLGLRECVKITDLTPLKGMPLKFLSLSQCADLDLTPLAGMNLIRISLPPNATKGIEVIRSMKSLTNIDNLPSEQFWKKWDAAKGK